MAFSQDLAHARTLGDIVWQEFVSYVGGKSYKILPQTALQPSEMSDVYPWRLGMEKAYIILA